MRHKPGKIATTHVREHERSVMDPRERSAVPSRPLVIRPPEGTYHSAGQLFSEEFLDAFEAEIARGADRIDSLATAAEQTDAELIFTDEFVDTVDRMEDDFFEDPVGALGRASKSVGGRVWTRGGPTWRVVDHRTGGFDVWGSEKDAEKSLARKNAIEPGRYYLEEGDRE